MGSEPRNVEFYACAADWCHRKGRMFINVESRSLITPNMEKADCRKRQTRKNIVTQIRSITRRICPRIHQADRLNGNL